MKIVNLVQGTEAWHQFRLTHNGASEAAAMLGLSKKIKRRELIRMKATGLAKEFSQWVQDNLLSRGHEVEARARPLVEEDIAEELYPVTCEAGKESASCDGLTLGGELAFEHKLWAVELAESVRQGIVPEEHMPQCQQILMVTGAERVRFTVSDGTRENMVWVDVLPDPDWFERLRAGWAQFDKDVAAYAPQADAEPVAIGRAPDTLPALRIEVTGAVTASNLIEFKQTALHAIRSVNRDLNTDLDFANADTAVKWCEDVESATKAAKAYAQGQMVDVDALFKALDDICAEARDVRLDLKKQSDRRKLEVREQAIVAARRALEQHIADLLPELGGGRLQLPAVDFGAAIKGLRSIASMQDALDTAVANGKIAADAQARTIRANRATLDAAEAGHIFPDFAQVCTKSADDFANMIVSRKAAVAARLEAEREKMRAEETAKAERKLREDLAEEDRQISSIWEQARRIEGKAVGYVQKAISYFEQGPGHFADDPRPRVAGAVREARAWQQEQLRLAQEHEATMRTQEAARASVALVTQAQDPQQVLKAEPATAEATDRGVPVIESPDGGPMGVEQPAAAGLADVASPPPAPVAGSVRYVSSAPAAEVEMIGIGVLWTRLGLDDREAFLASLGFTATPAPKGSGKLYRADDLQAIRRAASKHFAAKEEQQMEAA